MEYPQPISPYQFEKKDLVYLPGFNNIPVKNPRSAAIAPEELETYTLVWNMHFRIFDLADDKDKKDYESLMTAAASKEWVKVFYEVKPDKIEYNKENFSFPVAIKWGEQFLQPKDSGIFTDNKIRFQE